MPSAAVVVAQCARNRMIGVVYEGGIGQVIDTKLVCITGANDATFFGVEPAEVWVRNGGDVGWKHTAASLPNDKPQKAKH